MNWLTLSDTNSIFPSVLTKKMKPPRASSRRGARRCAGSSEGLEDETSPCCTADSPAPSMALMRRIWLTVCCRMAHLSGLTESELMSEAMLAWINSASSSMYVFSCSRRRFSLRHLLIWD